MLFGITVKIKGCFNTSVVVGVALEYTLHTMAI